MSDEKKPINLTETADAMIWAQEFVRTKLDNGWSLEDIDESLMVGWFASAMQTAARLQTAALEQRLAEAESWRGQIDAFVRRIMDEVNCGKACGGLDWDQNNPQSTTQVVIEGIKAHTQAAIDAALIDLIHDLGGLYIHRNGHELYNSAIDDVARFIKGQLGTNPLAEAQTKIKELNGLCLYHEGLERELQARIAELESERDRTIQHHERCAEKLFKAERELAEARKNAERYRWVRKHAYAVLSADGVDLHTGYQRKLYGTKSPRLWEEDNELDEAIDAAMRQEGEKC